MGFWEKGWLIMAKKKSKSNQCSAESTSVISEESTAASPEEEVAEIEQGEEEMDNCEGEGEVECALSEDQILELAKLIPRQLLPYIDVFPVRIGDVLMRDGEQIVVEDQLHRMLVALKWDEYERVE